MLAGPFPPLLGGGVFGDQNGIGEPIGDLVEADLASFSTQGGNGHSVEGSVPRVVVRIAVCGIANTDTIPICGAYAGSVVRTSLTNDAALGPHGELNAVDVCERFIPRWAEE